MERCAVGLRTREKGQRSEGTVEVAVGRRGGRRACCTWRWLCMSGLSSRLEGKVRVLVEITLMSIIFCPFSRAWWFVHLYPSIPLRQTTHTICSLRLRPCAFFCLDLRALHDEPTAATCCLVFVVGLERAQTLGLSVRRCGLAARPKAWLKSSEGWLYKYVVKVTRLYEAARAQTSPESFPPLWVGEEVAPYPLSSLTYDWRVIKNCISSVFPPLWLFSRCIVGCKKKKR